MDFKDRRIWYAVAAVIIVLIIIGYWVRPSRIRRSRIRAPM